jgi:adenosine deaminase
MNKKMDLALNQNSLEVMQSIPKSDLHSHGSRGGHVSYIAKWAGVKLESPPEKFMQKEDKTTLYSMQDWFEKTIKPYCIGFEGQLKRWEAAFVQAMNDSISIMSMSFRTAEIFKYFTEITDFIKTIQEYNRIFAPNTLLLPEITYVRDNYNDIDAESALLEEIVSYNFFKSIDICGDEYAQPAKCFKKMFRLAKSSGLILKAHVGEFGTSDDVMKAVEALELDEVHHGIAVASNPQIMKWLAANQIQLNICPTSNVMLGLVENYSTHPIKLFYEYGIPVTINTDDLLIFNQTVSQEYLNLYNAKTLNSEELNIIRETGLSVIKIGQSNAAFS